MGCDSRYSCFLKSFVTGMRASEQATGILVLPTNQSRTAGRDWSSLASRELCECGLFISVGPGSCQRK